MADLVRVELAGTLAGHHVVLDRDRITLGVLEDVESGKLATALDALASILADGDLPGGPGRAGLRALTVPNLRDLMQAVGMQTQVPKAG